MTIETFESWSLTIGITFLMLYMGFIVWDLAKKSNAGKFGTGILFFALGLGVVGFVSKSMIMEMLSL